MISVNISPDRSQIVFGSGDRAVRVWKRSKGGLESEDLRGHAGLLERVSISSDENRILSGSWDRTGRVCARASMDGRVKIHAVVSTWWTT